MKIAFFISDEGYGHAMRQKNIIMELLEHSPDIEITVFTKEKIDILQNYFLDRINYVQVHNNILIDRNDNGVINLIETKNNFEKWKKNNNSWFQQVLVNFDPKTNIIISDSVPQCSLLSEKFDIQIIFIHHFSWDWFYLKAFGRDKVFFELNMFYSENCVHIFPPLTPEENINMHPNHKLIDFIVNRSLIAKSYIKNDNLSKGKYKLLIMNSGTKSLTNSINELILSIPNNEIWNIFLRDQNLTYQTRKKILSSENIKLIEGLQNIHDSIANADLIVARGGYNLISEVLALGKLALIVDEQKNPEIESNLELIKIYQNLIPISREKLVESVNKVMNSESLFTKKYPKQTCLGATQAMINIINHI